MTDITPAKSSCCATPSGDACCAPEPSSFPWKQILLTPWTLVVAVPLLVLAFDPGEAGPVTLFAIRAFMGTLPYIVAAVLLIAWLKAAGAEATIGRVFEGRETQAIVLAALFGGLAPFCSCQVIPFIAGLLALGAPLPAIMAFWLSSPLIDPPTLLITAAALGWPFAIGKAVFAVGLGLFGGFTVKALVSGRTVFKPAQAENLGRLRLRTVAVSRGIQFGGFGRKKTVRPCSAPELRINALFLAKWLGACLRPGSGAGHLCAEQI
ncbi:permease [uncultured Roseibium sp.]|uniref:permease n=1 Tax=uncultured Roseibium sp. TaxID=1936171 RepID=UPI003216FF59